VGLRWPSRTSRARRLLRTVFCCLVAPQPTRPARWRMRARSRNHKSVAAAASPSAIALVGSRTGARAEGEPRHGSSPATSNAASGVIALRSRVCFTSRVMRPGERGEPSARRTHVIAIEEAKRGVQSRGTPVRPPKPATIPGAPQMASDLQLHPAFDELKAATRVSDGKISSPSPAGSD